MGKYLTNKRYVLEAVDVYSLAPRHFEKSL